MSDSRLPMPLQDLVPREAVEDCPTKFTKMPAAELLAVSVRGEQLTRILLQHYCPDLH